MNERQLEKLEELKEWLSNTLGSYGYTDKYSLETRNTKEGYAEVEVKVVLSVYNQEKRDYEDKDIYLRFEIYEDKIKINEYEDIFEDMDYSNYSELIWRKMFFEK